MEYLIIKGIGISLAIVGLRIVSSKGMILYFLRMPYEWLVKKLEKQKERCKELIDVLLPSDINSLEVVDFESVGKETKELGIRVRINVILIYLLKPLIGCCVCMASFYTIIIELVYFELTMWSILLIFMVATINSILFSLYEKLN